MPLRKARRPVHRPSHEVRRPVDEPSHEVRRPVDKPSHEVRRQVYKPSHEALKELDRLEWSSPNFPDQLVSLLSRTSFQSGEVCLSLQKEDTAWLIEYLDNALDTLEPVDPAYQKCLDVLRATCYNTEILPRSYILDVSSFVPVASSTSIGPYQIIYEGSIKGSKACAKKLSSEWPHVETYRFDKIVKWKRLTHPNIVPFLGITNEPIHLVWAQAPGVELHEYINNHPDTNRLDLLIGIANGLNYLHSCDVFHGDLGGPNIIVDEPGRPRIAEYDLNTLFLSPPKRTKVRGCMRWADPQWSSESKGDVFSFAMVMIEVFTAQAPFFPDPDSVALSALARGERPQRPTHMGLTAKLWVLVERCWDDNYRKRPEISEVLGILQDCHNDARTSISPDWLSQITDEILDLTDQFASVALFGPIGVGKSFVARTVLNNDRTKAKFGENRYFMCCDGLENSLEDFIKCLSDTIHTDAAQLESHLRSSPPIILLLDGVDFALDPLAPEAEEMYAMIEELGSYETICLVTTSRMYPDIHGFHRVEVPTPTEGGAQDIFYSLCNLARSPTVDTLIAKLDFHPFSIELFARTIRVNSWDEREMLKMWDDPRGVLKMTYYETLKNTIEPVFRSPRVKGLGTAARDVLEAIASFQFGIEEHQLEGIFCGTGGVREIVDVLCRFSLVYRRNGVLKMLSPLQFYFLESMIGKPAILPAVGVSPYGGGQLPSYMKNEKDCGPKAPRKRKWIRRLPQIVKKGLLALFGRWIAPTIPNDIQKAPAGIPPTGLRESLANIQATTTQYEPPEPEIPGSDPTNLSPVAPQEYAATLPLIVSRQQLPPAPVAYDMDQ